MTLHDRTTPTVGGALTAPANLRAICAARDAALEQMERAAAALCAAYDLTADAADTARAAHGGWHSPRTDRREDATRARLWRDGFDPAESLEAFRRDLDAAIWTRLLDESGLCRIMDAQEHETMDRALQGDVPPATVENIGATVDRLLGESELIFRRGIARAFAALDRRFKSHDGFRIGSRIILTGVFSDHGGFGYGSIRATLHDIERAFALLDHAPDRAGELESALARDRAGSWGPRQSEVETRYFKARGFKNGNAHLWLTRDDLVEKVNRELAEYYGAALADAAPDTARPEDYKPTGTAVARDLAFYPTPAAAVDALMDRLHLTPGARVLEPSAGIGNIVRAALARGAQVDAVEIHPGRADALLGIGHPALHVACTNFLTMRPEPVYDFVLMNPPFAGKHFMAHVRLAFDFLKPGGELRAILPASAEVNETPAHIRFRAWAERHSPGWRGLWRDLPPESFAEAGSRIATVILTLRKPAAWRSTFLLRRRINWPRFWRGFSFSGIACLDEREGAGTMTMFTSCSMAMSLDLHPLTVTLIGRDMPLSAIRVPAGFPSPAADDLEDTVDPMKWVVRHEHATFWWRVSGDSLEAEGILDGDLIAVDRAGRRRSGRIVLAVVDGQITVKKLARRNGAWFLDPRARSDSYETIPVTETTEIWGVVAGVVRRLPVE